MDKKIENSSINKVKAISDNQYEFNLKDILNKFLKQENRYEFDYFLAIIKQNQADREFVKQFLIQLKVNVDILEPSAFESTLISLIFYEIKWHEHYSNDDLILTSLTEFLTDLNSAYTNYNYKCLSMLIKIFTVVNSNGQIGLEIDLNQGKHLTNNVLLSNNTLFVINFILKRTTYAIFAIKLFLFY